MSDVTLINYTTRDFLSKAELELYISKQDNIFNENVISEFKKREWLEEWLLEYGIEMGISCRNTF